METRDQIGEFLIKEYTDLFRVENFNHRQAIDGLFQATVTEAQNSRLSRIPNREEILKAVNSLHPIKVLARMECRLCSFNTFGTRLATT